MDNLTAEQRRKNMQNIRSKGTMPERIVTRALRQQKIYFAMHVTSLPGTPDIVFRRKKIVIFIDSDFWHGHPKRFIMPVTNCKYWKDKIDNNRARDKSVNRRLRKEGWTVLRVWEYDVKNNLDRVLYRILSIINKTDGGV